MNLQNALLTAALGLTINAVAALSAQLSPVPNYTLTVIPLLPGGTINDTSASSINVEGDVVGNSGGHAFLYKKGNLIDIGALFPSSANVSSSGAVAVNAFDEVIGIYNHFVVINGNTYNAPAGSFIYYPWGQGRLELIPNPSGFVTNVLALNDLGQMVGVYGTSANPYDTGYSWLRQPNGRIDPLPLFNGQTVRPAAINNLGQIAATGTSSNIITILEGGLYYFSKKAPHTLLITGQHVQDLMVSVPTTYLSSFASCINDFGAVAGATELAKNDVGFDQPYHATLFFAGQVTDLGGIQGPVGNFTNWDYIGGQFYGTSYIDGINDFGMMVGGESDYIAPSIDPIGLIVVNGVVYDLNNYIPNPVTPSGIKLAITLGVAINNAGQILAWASDVTGVGSGIPGYIYPAYMVVMTPIRVKAIRP